VQCSVPGHAVAGGLAASLGLLLRLFSADGLRRVRDGLARQAPSPALAYFREQAESYITWVEPVVRYLQGRDPSLAHRLARPGVLPEGPRFEALRGQELGADGTLCWAFGSLGTADEAHYRASLFIDDVATAIRLGVDPGFGLSRYEESLCQSLQRLDPLLERLEGPPTLVDEAIDAVAGEIVGSPKLRVAALTVPFPGTLYGALRLARALRRLAPALKVILGGGYVSTELRALAEPRLFRYVDYVCLDRGFMPMLGVLRHMMTHDDGDLVRTFTAAGDRVVFHDHPVEEPRHADLPAPCTQGLPLDRYIGLAEMLNPMAATGTAAPSVTPPWTTSAATTRRRRHGLPTGWRRCRRRPARRASTSSMRPSRRPWPGASRRRSSGAAWW